MTRPEVGIHLLVSEGLKVLRACPTHRGPWAGEFRFSWLCQVQALDYNNRIFTEFSLIREGNVTLGQVRRPWLWPLPLDPDTCCVWNSLPPNVGRGYSQWLPYAWKGGPGVCKPAWQSVPSRVGAQNPRRKEVLGFLGDLKVSGVTGEAVSQLNSLERSEGVDCH